MKTKISKPTVETITAEINVVKIGNKQMTISVFNQLYTEKCWDDEYNILYPVWGKIKRNYEYVIFQKNNELRKCHIPNNYKKIDFYDFVESYFESNKDHVKRPDYDDPNYDILYLVYKVAHLNSSTEDRKLAYSFLTEVSKKECDEQFRLKNWLIEKQNKMVFDLNNSRQLFIAI